MDALITPEDRVHSELSLMADELRELQRQRDELVDENARLKVRDVSARQEIKTLGATVALLEQDKAGYADSLRNRPVIPLPSAVTGVHAVELRATRNALERLRTNADDLGNRHEDLHIVFMVALRWIEAVCSAPADDALNGAAVAWARTKRAEDEEIPF